MADEVRGGERLVRLGWAGLVVTLGLALVAAGIALSLRSFAAAGAAAHLLAALPAWLGILVLGQREERARAERLEAARLQALAAEGRKPIFAEGGREADAAAALERFKRGGQLLVCLVVAASELALAWGLASAFPRGTAEASLAGAAALCGAAFALRLLGRYGFALAARGVSVGGAGGRRATSGALATFLAGLSLALRHSFDLPQVDLLGWAFVGLGGLLGVEALLLLLLDLYRPRRPGEELRPAFDSRLLGLLSAPGDIARSIARAADYQFGFALSQTWFYRFLERWVAPLVGFAALTFWLLSTLYVVEPHEQALVRRLGRSRDGARGPGLHLKLPWPVDLVVRQPVGTPRLLVTGHGPGEAEHEDDEHHESDRGGGEEAILWTESHVQGSDQLVLLARRARGGEAEERGTVAVNLLSVSAHVDWRISALEEWLANVIEPEALLELLVERELSFLFSGEDLDAILLQRDALARRLEARLREVVAAHRLGVEIQRVSLTDLHPPVEVGKAFAALTAAHEERAALVHSARGWAATIVPEAETRALAERLGAEAQARNEVALAAADAHRFQALVRLDRAAPGVLRAIRLLDETVAGAARARKLVVSRPQDRGLFTDLDLEERVQAEELGLGELPGGAAAAGGDKR